jgi:hypothetical protein
MSRSPSAWASLPERRRLILTFSGQSSGLLGGGTFRLLFGTPLAKARWTASSRSVARVIIPVRAADLLLGDDSTGPTASPRAPEAAREPRSFPCFAVVSAPLGRRRAIDG